MMPSNALVFQLSPARVADVYSTAGYMQARELKYSSATAVQKKLQTTLQKGLLMQ